MIGSWQWAAASPDGRTILVQWSAECEADESGVFLIDLAGNKTRIAAASPDARLALHRSLRPRSLDAIKREFAAPG